MSASRVWVFVIFCLFANSGIAAPPGFVKTTIPLGAPPVGLAFDAEGVLYALENPAPLTNTATLRVIHPDGTFGDSYSVVGSDPDFLFIGSMAYDPIDDRLLISDNTSDGRLYAVDKLGVQQTVATGIANIAGIAVRSTGEIFVSTAPFGSPGEVLLVDRTNGSTTPVLSGLELGAGLAFDLSGDLIAQDAYAVSEFTYRGRLQRQPITETPGGLEFLDEPVLLLDNMQPSAGLTIDGNGSMFATGSGGLFRVEGEPLTETSFDNNGNPNQFATAMAFDPGSLPFEGFMGPSGGRLAYMADFGFTQVDSFITLLTPARPGDYNSDVHVDEADYEVWQRLFGSELDLAADGTGDNVVDAADYVIWRHNEQSMLFEMSASGPFSVPEPAMLLLTILGGGALGVTFPRRARARSAAPGRVPARRK